MATAVFNKGTYSVSLAKAKVRLRVYINYGEDPDWKDQGTRCYHRLLELIEKGISGPYGVLELEKAVIANQKADTDCILVTLNARQPYFVVSDRIYRPEVVSCKLWRSPNLLPATKIQPIAPYNTKDQFNHHMKSTYRQGQRICVNPYHYNCSDLPVDPDIVIKRNIKLRLLEQKKDGGTQTWKDRSIDCIFKAFDFIGRTDSHGLYKLDEVIVTESAETGCILVDASARFELGYWPHNALYRLWRCPEIKSNVIQPIEKYGGNEDKCHVTGVDNEYENICVNPYHYIVKIGRMSER